MKTDGKEILRWITIAAFGGFGIWALIDGTYHVVTHSQGHWAGAVFPMVVLVLFVTPFLIVAKIVYRRTYRELFRVLGVVGAIIVLGTFASLLDRSHVLFDFLYRHADDSPWLPLLGFPLSLLCLFAPMYASAWVWRVCRGLANRPDAPSSQPPPNGATGTRST